MAYMIPESLPWNALSGPLAAAEDGLARLDERLGSSPIREGWIGRTHFVDACASLWLQGELVHLEDLVLHDAAMDQRAPTHELTRAHAVLRTRRRIAANDPGWATSSSGLATLSRGREKADDAAVLAREPAPANETDDEREGEGGFDDEGFAAELAAVDALLERSNRVLAGATPARAHDPLALIYDLDWVWCTNPMVDVGRSLDALSGDALRHRHPEPGHPVEHRAADPGFGLLGRQSPGAQAATDDSFVAEHRGLPKRAPAVADRLLPAQAPLVPDHLDVLVPLTGRGAHGRARHRG
jgi:hypothetical protein